MRILSNSSLVFMIRYLSISVVFLQNNSQFSVGKGTFFYVLNLILGMRKCFHKIRSPPSTSLEGLSLSVVGGYYSTNPASFNMSMKRMMSAKLSASGNCASCIFLMSKTLSLPEVVSLAMSSLCAKLKRALSPLIN